MESNIQDRGVFIKWSFFRDGATTISEKFIFIEILNLSNLDLGCVAHNGHFSELMGIKKQAVSRLISSLEKKGFITTHIAKGSRNFDRIIKITTPKQIVTTPKQIVTTPLTICLETKENKTINKTINKGFAKNEAESIYKSYSTKLKSSTNKQQSLNNISKWLKEFNKEQLLLTIDNYTATTTDTELKFIKDCKNFFGVARESNGFFKEFLEAKEIKAVMPNGQAIPSYMQ